MANIEVRKHAGTTTTQPTTRERMHPLRMMRDLMNWDPFREMTPAWPEIAEFSPAFDVTETKDAYVFKADVPGVKENDIEVTVNGTRLTVTGKRDEEKEEKTERQYTYERSYGSFTRSFTLPEGIDAASTHADLQDGVLTLTVRKSQEAQSKKIPIQTQSKKS